MSYDTQRELEMRTGVEGVHRSGGTTSGFRHFDVETRYPTPKSLDPGLRGFLVFTYQEGFWVPGVS